MPQNSPPLTALGAVRSHDLQGATLTLDCGGPSVAVSIVAPGIARVRLAPDGRLAPRKPWAVTAPDEALSAPQVTLEQLQDTLLLRSELLTVVVELNPCRIALLDAQGRRFCADAGPMTWDETGMIAARKQSPAEEHFYGFGERTGMLDRRSRELVNWTTDPEIGHGPSTDPMYMAIPVGMVLQPGLAYGVFLNNTFRSSFDLGRTQPSSWAMQVTAGELDYYIFAGPRPAEVLERVGQLLGTTPLPPRWALGYHQSRWSYESAAIIRELAANFRGRDIPCDVIHFDIDYMHGYRVFTWDPERFPDPETLIADLRAQGFRVVTIIDPGVKADPNYEVYQQGLERGSFITTPDGEPVHGYVWPDDSVFPDFVRDDVRAWWGTHQQKLTDVGVSGIWNDMNEPVVFGKPFSEGGGNVGTLPLDAPQGPQEARTTHAELHNLYGMSMARASYEGLRRSLGDERPFVLTRSGFAGMQRWSAGWMGDNSSVWEHLELCLPQLMGMGMSGVPFVGVDIGGFWGNATSELFARWVEIGALLPFCRGHSSAGTERHEPWIFGPQVEQISRDYLRLRYRLLPYLYSLFWEAHRAGSPVLRPLLYHFPDDEHTYHLHDQVLLGPWLMAAPVIRPGKRAREVYLPEGEWFDWWTDDVISGPCSLLAPAPLEHLPLYIRAGAIIPTQPPAASTDQQPTNVLTLEIFPGDGQFTLYEDDGHTYAYERGEWATTLISQHREGEHLVVQLHAREGQYSPPKRRVFVRVHGVGPYAADGRDEITYDQELRMQVLSFEDDGRARTLRFWLG